MKCEHCLRQLPLLKHCGKMMHFERYGDHPSEYNVYRCSNGDVLELDTPQPEAGDEEMPF